MTQSLIKSKVLLRVWTSSSTSAFADAEDEARYGPLDQPELTFNATDDERV